MTNEQYMQMAIDLAKRGEGWTNPDPMVGAVVVQDGIIIGNGYLKKHGEQPAVLMALASCSESPVGASMYITMEPCCQKCVEAIQNAGIKKVYIASVDPNPNAEVKGVVALKEAGIEVVEGLLREECDDMNTIYMHYIRHKVPFVLLKYAMTMDGKTATKSGKSKWVTGDEAQVNVHLDRHRFTAIMVGVGTIIYDDSRLTSRLPDTKNPIRIICDSHLRTPFNSLAMRTAKQIPTIIATCETSEELLEPYRMVGCDIVSVPERDGHVDLNALMIALGQKGIDSVLMEGGARLAWSAMQCGIVNRIHAYVAPVIFGGAAARMPIEGAGVDDPAHGIRLTPPKVKLLGNDVLLECEVLSCSLDN